MGLGNRWIGTVVFTLERRTSRSFNEPQIIRTLLLFQSEERESLERITGHVADEQGTLGEPCPNTSDPLVFPSTSVSIDETLLGRYHWYVLPNVRNLQTLST